MKTEMVPTFERAFKESNISDLEMSWNLGCSLQEFKTLLAGERMPTEKEDSILLNFILKTHRKRPFLGL